MPSALIGELINAGIRAILISVAIEITLLVLAFGIGVGVWIAHAFLSGIAAGILTFVVGQAFAVSIIDMTVLLDEHPQESTRKRSDNEVLAELRKELETTADQAVASNRSLPPSLKSTSPVRGPED